MKNIVKLLAFGLLLAVVFAGIGYRVGFFIGNAKGSTDVYVLTYVGQGQHHLAVAKDIKSSKLKDALLRTETELRVMRDSLKDLLKRGQIPADQTESVKRFIEDADHYDKPN